MFMISTLSYSQCRTHNFFFLKSGKNISKFKFSTPYSVRKLKSDIGDSNEFGHSFNINCTNTDYEIALSLNRFKPFVGFPESEVRYSLHYLGINNAILYPIIGSSLRSRFVLQVRAGVSLNKLISGIQSIEGEIHNIKNFPEFKGILFMGSLGLQSKLYVHDNTDLILGYNYASSIYNSGQIKNESLTVSSHQIVVGIHFLLR